MPSAADPYPRVLSLAPTSKCIFTGLTRVHSQSEFAAEKFQNPKRYAPAMKAFGIKTACQRFSINCYEPIGEIKPVKIEIRRCLDPNLEKFIEIEIMED